MGTVGRREQSDSICLPALRLPISPHLGPSVCFSHFIHKRPPLLLLHDFLFLIFTKLCLYLVFSASITISQRLPYVSTGLSFLPDTCLPFNELQVCFGLIQKTEAVIFCACWITDKEPAGNVVFPAGCRVLVKIWYLSSSAGKIPWIEEVGYILVKVRTLGNTLSGGTVIWLQVSGDARPVDEPDDSVRNIICVFICCLNLL